MSLVAGTYTGAQTITLKDATAGATIYFTTNGATPTIASPRYATPFKVSATSTVKAFAVSSTTSESKVASATYTIKLPAAEPTMSLVAGTYTGAQTITLKDATAGATIYFTTNGVTPTIASPRYTAPFKVSATSTVKAIAVSSTTSDSKVASATYTIKVAAAAAAAM
jgi:hypothetical protein